MTTVTTYDRARKARSNADTVAIVDKGSHALLIRIQVGNSRSNMSSQAFVHVLGLPVTMATANGCGYDRKSAAVFNAVEKALSQGHPWCRCIEVLTRLRDRMREHSGRSWEAAFQDDQTILLIDAGIG